MRERLSIHSYCRRCIQQFKDDYVKVYAAGTASSISPWADASPNWRGMLSSAKENAGCRGRPPLPGESGRRSAVRSSTGGPPAAVLPVAHWTFSGSGTGSRQYHRGCNGSGGNSPGTERGKHVRCATAVLRSRAGPALKSLFWSCGGMTQDPAPVPPSGANPGTAGRGGQRMAVREPHG